MQVVDIAYRTLFAELNQRTLDSSFATNFSNSGNFVRVPVKGRYYWYFDEAGAKPKRRYVGPADDPEIERRVAEFKSIKDDAKARRRIVSTLTREVGLTAPDRMTGDVVEALERAGIFRLRAVLVGTVAYQTYSAYLGAKLPGAAMQTGDADFAQFHSISTELEDSLPPMLDVLRAIDSTFRAIPHRADGRHSSQFVNAANYRVEFLTPNRAGDDLGDHPVSMPALGGASAEPLRYLDFLIRHPVRTTLLHRSGVPVTVPAPHRYAVHKLIVAAERPDHAAAQSKRDKDLMQSRSLFEAMTLTRRQDDLAEAFEEAWSRGPHWRSAIARGMRLSPDKDRPRMIETLRQGLSDIGRPDDILTELAL